MCWRHLVLPWANQYVFLTEKFFLSYVNETMYLLWNLPFFKMVLPKTNYFFFFFLFSTLGLIMAQETSIHVNCFMAGGWHTLVHPISKMHIVGAGPGETPSALRCLSYLINKLANRHKTPCQKLARGHSFCPFLMSMSAAFSLSLSLLYFNKILLPKRFQWGSLVSCPGSNSSPPETTNPGIAHSSQQEPVGSFQK